MSDKQDESRIKKYMAAKMKHIKMYNECMNLADGLDVSKFAELVRADEREAMVTEAAKQGWVMKNENPFEDAVQEIAAIRARGEK